MESCTLRETRKDKNRILFLQPELSDLTKIRSNYLSMGVKLFDITILKGGGIQV